MTDDDFWTWYNGQLKDVSASVSKTFLMFLVAVLLTIALGFGWIEIEKISQLGTSAVFTTAGSKFLFTISGLVTLGLFFTLFSLIFEWSYFGAPASKVLMLRAQSIFLALKAKQF